MKNTKYIVLVYNNTRGVLEPSEKDKDLTDQLMHATELLYLQVIEHLIITKEGFYSFNINGVLD
ncbi:MAG: JAB domain-containing protein [Candidatus Marithrix sp.]